MHMRSDPLTAIPPAFYGARDANAARILMIWLFSVCGLIALMVTIGGATRLTDSGLSITQWDPVLGALPPRGEAAWLVEFEKYKKIPEYTEVNRGMSLAEFKVIYWWEWAHRNLGRFTGLAFLVPYLVFLIQGKIVTPRLGAQLGGLFILICAQGALGWYMVSSGLSGRVDVSQYRLAAHLGLAAALFAACLWTGLQLRTAQGRLVAGDKAEGYVPNVALSPTLDRALDRALDPAPGPALIRWTGLLLALVFCQIILGAFVAGLRAGHVYTTWPLMDGAFFPDAYFSAPARLRDMFENIAAVQFNHRLMAYVLVLAACLFYVPVRRLPKPHRGLWQRQATVLLAAISAQAGLGVWTLMMATPLALALFHQAGALLVLSLAIINVHLARLHSASTSHGLGSPL